MSAAGHGAGEIGKFDPEIMKRLLAYLKPYRVLAALTLLALALATVAELATPLVMRRAMDDHVLRRYFRIDPKALASADTGGDPTVRATLSGADGTVIGDDLFVEPSALAGISGKQREDARTRGWLDKDEWYLVVDPEPESREIIDAHPELFRTGDNTAAIRFSDRRLLEPEEVRRLRIDDVRGLVRRAAQYIGLLIVSLLLTFSQVIFASRIGQNVMRDIRMDLLGHLVRQTLRFLNRTPVGSLVTRVANDVETINQFFTDVTLALLKDVAMMIGVVAVLYALDSRLALIATITIPPVAILTVLFRKRVREAYRVVRAKVSAVNAYLSERLSGMSTVQLFAAEKRSEKEFDEQGGDLLRAELREMRIHAIFRPLVNLLAAASIAVVIWYATGLHESGLLTLGVLIAFIDLIEKFFGPVRDMADKFTIMQSAMAGGERVFDLLDDVDRIPDDGASAISSPPKKQSGEIRFEKVEFSYVPDEPVLRGLDFTIHPGETVAVVGATGAGKTTIANLITRLWDVDGGRITLDGRNIREWPLSELRRTVQPVQQDVFLFAGSVSENIELGLDLDEGIIRDAARLARADGFIDALPDGYDTEMTEGATNISAGQRQLVAFARIISHNPRVIILDEATSNVDTETETLLQQGLDGLLRDRTALIIAHRLSTIRRADRILVLGHGKLLEEGSHEELLALDGVYANLYRLQFAQGDTEAPAV